MLFDRPQAGSRAVLLNLHLNSSSGDIRADAEELTQLARSGEVEPVALIQTRRDRPHPR